jgi:hypothetical protein
MKQINNNNLNQQERILELVQDENYKFWLGGFVEGEGTLVISIVRNSDVANGIVLQPEFSVAQHENGIQILHSFKALFEGKGSVHAKSGSEKVWVYSLKGIQNLKQYVLPFFSNYVVKYSSKYKSDVFQNFQDIIARLDTNKKKTMEKTELVELIKLVYLLNPDSKGKSRKRTLGETLAIIDQHHITKVK